VYGWLLRGRSFPVSERVAAGVSFRSMLAEAGVVSALIASALVVFALGGVFAWSRWVQLALIAIMTFAYGIYSRSLGRPLFILMLLVMIPLATTELGTDSWITSLMEPEMTRLGLHPGWVLIYTSALMLILRLNAGPLVHRLKPVGLLALGSAVAAVGLWMMSSASGLLILGAATLYGLGKAFFWPTSLGFVSEQFPRGGAVTLNLVAAVGMLAVGSVGSVTLGAIQDHATERALVTHDEAHGTQWADELLGAPRAGVFGEYRALDQTRFAQADAQTRADVAELLSASKKEALRTVACLPLIMLAVYLALAVYFRLRGGYRPQLVT